MGVSVGGVSAAPTSGPVCAPGRFDENMMYGGSVMTIQPNLATATARTSVSINGESGIGVDFARSRPNMPEAERRNLFDSMVARIYNLPGNTDMTAFYARNPTLAQGRSDFVSAPGTGPVRVAMPEVPH